MMGCYYDQLMLRKYAQQKAAKAKNESRLETVEKIISELIRGLGNLGSSVKDPGMYNNQKPLPIWGDERQINQYGSNLKWILMLVIAFWLCSLVPNILDAK